ncbi:MAG: P1 family peptidase [Elusimicrobia bacterium]|nr:P1 family peptidase [Elusimicrobiota bacterium]
MAVSAAAHARSADLGIRIGHYASGPLGAITDVAGVRVGHKTIYKGEGEHAVRTGVTAVLPADGDLWNRKVYAGSFILNGNGEAAGLMWVQESGILETPVALTNTLSVGPVQEGLVRWMLERNPKVGISDDTLTPVVFECDDSGLSDIRALAVRPEDALEALAAVSTGPVLEGAVGAGTGMTSYQFKGGIGTASRVLEKTEGGWTVGVLVNANHGQRRTLRVGGAAVGEELSDLMPKYYEDGSIVVLVATDAPLESRQLSRLAKRAMLGVARTGAVAYHGSGDVALSWSTANRLPHYPEEGVLTVKVLSDFHVDGLFEAAAEAAEEAVVNALLAGKTTVGRGGNTVHALPQDRLVEALKRRRALK